MAIETFGLTFATLEPYLSHMEGQFGTPDDHLSDTDLTEIITTEAATLGIAIGRALSQEGVTRLQAIEAVAADEYGNRAARGVLVYMVLARVYQSIYHGSVLPEYLQDQRNQAQDQLDAVTEDPQQLALDITRPSATGHLRPADEVESISAMFVDTGRSRLDNW